MVEMDEHLQPPSAINVEHRIKRDMAEMIGYAKGVTSDGVVSEDEAMGLMTWADDHPDVILTWPANVIYRRLRTIFSDGYASEEEREDLKGLLAELVGGEGGTIGGETASTGLPLDDPPPLLETPDRLFVLTGRFAYGTRASCVELIKNNGGWDEPRVTKQTDYLIIGAFASRDWLQTSYGNKIKKAVEYRDKYSRPHIISEEHWTRDVIG